MIWNFEPSGSRVIINENNEIFLLMRIAFKLEPSDKNYESQLVEEVKVEMIDGIPTPVKTGNKIVRQLINHFIPFPITVTLEEVNSAINYVMNQVKIINDNDGLLPVNRNSNQPITIYNKTYTFSKVSGIDDQLEIELATNKLREIISNKVWHI